MFALSSTLPADSRVWIYQSDRPFSTDEENRILELGKQFVETWTAHNKNLLASFEIRYNRFLIFMIDQNQAGASGCSIDKSVHFIQQLEKQFGLNLLDRMNFAYKDGNSVKSEKRNAFASLLQSGSIDDNTIVFNNLIDRKSDLETNWEIPLSNSWHKSAL